MTCNFNLLSVYIKRCQCKTKIIFNLTNIFLSYQGVLTGEMYTCIVVHSVTNPDWSEMSSFWFCLWGLLALFSITVSFPFLESHWLWQRTLRLEKDDEAQNARMITFSQQAFLIYFHLKESVAEEDFRKHVKYPHSWAVPLQASSTHPSFGFWWGTKAWIGHCKEPQLMWQYTTSLDGYAALSYLV